LPEDLPSLLFEQIRELAGPLAREEIAVAAERVAGFATPEATEGWSQERLERVEAIEQIILSATEPPQPPAPPAPRRVSPGRTAPQGASSSAAPAPAPPAPAPPAPASSDDWRAWLRSELEKYIASTPGIAADHPRNSPAHWIPLFLPEKIINTSAIANGVYRREGLTTKSDRRSQNVSNADKERLREEVNKQILAFAIQQLHYFDQKYKALDPGRPNIAMERMHQRGGFVRQLEKAAERFGDAIAQEKTA
jgi:hypothetical protein